MPGRLRRVAQTLDHRGQPLTFSDEERIGVIRLSSSIGHCQHTEPCHGCEAIRGRWTSLVTGQRVSGIVCSCRE